MAKYIERNNTPMSQINEILNYLGAPYFVTTRDGEPVICRTLEDFELEISGLRKRALNCSLYVWMTHPHRELINVIYLSLPSVKLRLFPL